MTSGGIKGFWQDRFQHERFERQLNLCLREKRRLTQEQLSFISALAAKATDREEIRAMTGYDWTPSAGQLNYLNSVYEKVSR